MRRHVANLCMLLCIHLVLYGRIDMCSEVAKSENLDCYTNYADRISCFWYKGSDPGNGSFILTLLNNEETYDNDDYRDDYDDDNNDDDDDDKVRGKCHLAYSPYDESFNCNISYPSPSETHNYTIIVQDLSSTENLATKWFEPACNIKLDPPSDLSYNLTDTAYNITWVGNSRFRGVTKIYYQLQLKKGASSQVSIHKTTFHTFVEVQVSEFHEGSNYIQVRCKTEDQWEYKSQWSEWSSQLEIELEKRTQKQDIIHIITIVTLLTMTLILFLLVLCSNMSSRINVSFLKKIPTAADFFYPLYHIHDGNFQDWTKHPNKCKESRKGGQHGFPQDIDLYSTTVLYVQTDDVSPVKIESPPSKEDVPLTHDICNSIYWSDALEEKEMSVSRFYRAFFSGFPSFSNDIVDEKDAVSSLDCPAEYFSYDGSYVPNSQEITE